MNRAQALILADSPELVSSGLWPDRHAAQTPLWEIAQNAEFAGGKIRRRVPNSLITQPVVGVPIRGIGQMQASNGVRWIWFSAANSIYRWYGPAPEAIGTPANYTANQSSVADATFFDFTAWGNWMLYNSRENVPNLYQPGTGNVPLGDAPTDALMFLKKRNQLLAIGHDVNGRQVSFSDADDIFSWTPTPENLAGTIPLEELSTPTKSACHFGPSVAVFGENQMFAVNWVGAPYYYGQQKLLDGIGCVGKMACCSAGRLVFGFSRNGAWKTDGLQYSYIDEVVLRDYLQENVNWAQRSKISVQRNDITGCIEFSFPMRTALEPNEAWAYDPRYGGWSQVPPFTILSSRLSLDKPIQGQPTGKVELVEDNPALDGDLLLETKGMLIQRDNQMLHIGALIDEIELFIHSASNVEFQYGVAESPEGPFSWSEPQEVKADTRIYKLKQRVSGVYHKLRFKNFNTNWSLDLQGFALFGAVEGYKREKA